jgi:hypothetical protein
VFTWHLHAPTPFDLSGDDLARVENGGAACDIWLVSPEDLAVTTTDRFDPPPRPRVKLVEHHLAASTTDARTRALGLTVLRVRRSGASAELAYVEGPDRWHLTVPQGDHLTEVLVGPGLALGATVRDTDGELLARFER